jgi:hypothetical protein
MNLIPKQEVVDSRFTRKIIQEAREQLGEQEEEERENMKVPLASKNFTKLSEESDDEFSDAESEYTTADMVGQFRMFAQFNY